MTTNRYADSIQRMLPDIRARREEIEELRGLPHDLVDRLIATGTFALGAPRALGGEELDPLDQLRVIETVSMADGSTGWCTMIWIGNGIVSGYMADRGAKEVFADPAIPTAASIAPSGQAVEVDGGFRVAGRWRFASGVDHAMWMLAGCVVMKDGAPQIASNGMPRIVHVFVPGHEVRIHDTWRSSGLRGTGSNDFEIVDAFVPEERLVAVFDLAGRRPEPLFQVPTLALFSAHAAAVGLGIARAALSELSELAVEKTPSFSTATMADKPVTQVEVARAEAALGAARAFLYEALDDLWQTVSAGRKPTNRQHAMCRIAAVYASDTGARVARTMNVLAGGSSIYASSPLQRHARDADAVTHHVTQSPQMWEEAGRVLLGREPLFPIF